MEREVSTLRLLLMGEEESEVELLDLAGALLDLLFSFSRKVWEIALAVHWSSSRLLLKILELAGKWLSELRCLSVFTTLLLLDKGKSAVRSIQADNFGETNLLLELTSSTSSSTPEMTSTENNLDCSCVYFQLIPNILPPPPSITNGRSVLVLVLG